MIEEFSPQPEQQSKQRIKNLAFITEEGSPDYEFGICYLMDKQEEAIIYSPGDKSYDVKHNVGKKITFTGLHPAKKGNRKWVAKAAPLELMPEELRSEIVTPANHLAETVDHKTAELSEAEKIIDKRAKMDFTEKLSFFISTKNHDYLKAWALSVGLRGEYAKSIVLNEVIELAFNNGYLRD